MSAPIQNATHHGPIGAKWILGVSLAVIICSVPAVSSFSQTTKSKSVDKQLQKEIIDTVVSYFDRNYVFQDVACQMGEYLYKRLESGDYNEITSTEAFVDSLTVDMRSISKDDHIRIYYRPDEYFKPDKSEEMNDKGWETSLAQNKYFNFDFVKVERLLGNIGYMRFNQFRDAEQAGATAIAALNFLAYCDALIIDLRTNGGGDPSMIQLISSYFFDEPRHLNSFYIRRSDSTQEFWTHPEVKGPRMSDIDLYILVSKHTFSAAEEFAYNLKHMGRATLIGQVTGGGAHHSEFHKIEHLNIELKVPYAMAVNPITGTNWEQVGVVPHIEASYSESYDIAYLEAAKRVKAKTTNDYKAARLDWVICGLQAKLNPIAVDEKILKGYVGKYGIYEISLAGGILYIREGDYPTVELKPLSNSIFQWGNNQCLRIEFNVGDGGHTTTLIAHELDDGTFVLGERTE
jgi:hypothetical protein